MNKIDESKRSRVMVLLVDDQAMIAEAVRRCLANEPDIDFHFCSEGSKAIEVAERIHPTIILQDLVMPDIDGLALVNEYRNNNSTMAVPVIVLSVKEDPTTKSKAFEAGANDYLVKLPDRIELLARVRYHSNAYLNYLQKEEATRALRESQQQLLDTNTALLSLNQKLEIATRAKSDFLAIMSHEVRTPLNAVLGFSDLLVNTSLNDEQREYINIIRASGDTLLAVLNDILDFSKIEAGKLAIEEEQVDIRQCTHEACMLFSPKAQNSGTAISYAISESVPKIVCGDPTRIRQILTNLISNAVKFTKEGSITIGVEATSFEDLKSHGGSVSLPSEENSFLFLKFSVRDTGNGIPKDKQQSLFQTFQQADASIARKYGGTGLGLAICRRLSQLMGGEVWFEQPQGPGSEFVFIIRCRKFIEKSRHLSFDKLKANDQEIDLVSLSALKVLLAEDSNTNAKLFLNLLKKFKVSADHVTDGETAVEMFQVKRPDLIFMDIQMPKLDGLQATQLIRHQEELKQWNRSYIIALTAEAMQGVQEKCFAAGMDDYLSKPFSLEQLKQVLINALTKIGK